jgi:acetyl esterase/lipase
MSFLTYLYYKFFATLLRAVTWLGGGRPLAFPDEVRHIPSRDNGRTIKIHVYHAASTPGPSPVLLNFHGSGFVLHLHGSDHEFCRQISEQTKYTVLDVPYRLAPEDPFPAAIHDVEDAIKYALGRPDEFDLSCLSLSGFSAGANLALAASATLFSPETFRSLIAFYPPLDLNTDPAAKVAPDPNGRVIPVRVARLFNRCYVPSDFDPRDPRISPRFAQLDRFPGRMLMITCDGDSLALEGEELAEKLQHEGHYVVRERMHGCNHAWDKRTSAGTPQRQAKERAYKLAVEMLNE